MKDHRVAFGRLRAEAEAGRLAPLCRQHRVVVLGAHGSATEEAGGQGARDLDLAVWLPHDATVPDLLGLADELARLAGGAEVDLMDLRRAEPVARTHGLGGVPLYEDRPGRFAELAIAACSERLDTAWLRRLERGDGRMTPRVLDPEVVQGKLRHMQRLRSDLAAMGELSRERLDAEPISRHAAEWILTQTAQLAASAATYLAVRSGDIVPTTYAQTFTVLAQLGVVDDDLAARLARLAGMRNVLVHRYDDVDLGRLADGLAQLPGDSDAFVRQVTTHLRSLLDEA